MGESAILLWAPGGNGRIAALRWAIGRFFQLRFLRDLPQSKFSKDVSSEFDLFA